jgi:hypothetical protein
MSFPLLCLLQIGNNTMCPSWRKKRRREWRKKKNVAYVGEDANVLRYVECQGGEMMYIYMHVCVALWSEIQK